MKNVLSFFFLFIIANSFAQLDPFYFGTYKSADALEKYTIYSMDEIEVDCFIVEYDRFQGTKVVEHWEGYGHCDGEGGKMEVFMQKGGKPLRIEFAFLEKGIRSLTIFSDNDYSKVFLEFNEY
jgi:hypothetical protein